ncbi:MAG TPA: hypothetical protein VFK05_14575 [Polyangiaceae bacterium]|nr:hypothetical protein [Polyangiaceae bacterium]
MLRTGWKHRSISSGAVAICLFALSNAACGQAQSSEGSHFSAAGRGIPSAGAASTSAGSGGTTSVQPVGLGGFPDLNVNNGGAMEGSSGSGTGGGCAATFVKAESQTLAMFIMLDQSKSMDNIVDTATMTTRWGAVTSALNTFVSNPAAATIPVGLQYFGLGGAQNPTMPGIPGQGVSCTASDYAQADVPIAPLSGNARLITASMAMHAPSTNTPTLPAVEGGVQFVAKYASAHPENKVVLVLATDGEPSGCNSTLMNVSAAAAAGLAGTPSVETYVIGVGDNLTNLDAIAVAGGTKHAFLIGDANVQQELLTALTAIQGDVLPCQYPVPAPETGNTLDFSKVNVQFTPGSGGTQQEFQKVAGASACMGGNNLWYYDNEMAPTQILLCPDTCTKVTSDGMAKVNIVLDCKHTVEPPR